MTVWERRDLVRDTKWYDLGRCVGLDPELFFPNPVKRDGIETEETRDAKAVCAECPSKAECLEDAIAADDDGIRGGLTYDERRALVRKRRRPRTPSTLPPIEHGTPKGWAQHHARRIDPCEACQTAYTDKRDRERRALLAKRHGSKAGYQLHRRLDEKACDPCLAAQAVESAQARDERRKAKA